MTIKELREQLSLYPDDTVLLALNGDDPYDQKVMPVTGLLFTTRRGPDEPPTLEFRTDEEP